MNRTFDLLVIGTGVAAEIATRCAKASWSVAVVDSRPYGGTCALRGCVPKKILVGAAETVHVARSLTGKGVPAADLALDWPDLIRFKRSLVEPTPARTEREWGELGVAQFHGRARFTGPTALAIGDEQVTARRIVIAAGARPAPLPFPGAEHLITSDEFLELPRLPVSCCFVGGGYVSFELAHVAARAGARATIVHKRERPLDGFDPALVDMLVARSRALGIAVELGAHVQGIEESGGRLVVRAARDRSRVSLDADLVVHGAGRVPDLDDLDLPAANVAREKRGVTVDAHLRSVSNPAVYAAGDAAASGPPLTPKASHDVEVLAVNLLEDHRRTVNYEGLASVVFSIPPLAAAGLTEAEARERGLRFRTSWRDTSDWFSTQRLGETVSAYKLLIEEPGNRILGAHLLGPGAEEAINVFSAAIRLGIRADDLKQVLFAYPTAGGDIPHML
jgi:glutathione reductase (NADPH)